MDELTRQAISDALGSSDWFHMLPLGVVVCTAMLAEALPVERIPHDRFGDYPPGRWAWRLTEVRPIKPHIPAKGMQLWGWPWLVPDCALASLPLMRGKARPYLPGRCARRCSSACRDC
jgi:hypothetical protein